MPKKDEKKLLKTHMSLLNDKRMAVGKAMQELQDKKLELNETVNIVMDELGIPEEERGKWRITDVFQMIEKIKESEVKEDGK